MKPLVGAIATPRFLSGSQVSQVLIGREAGHYERLSRAWKIALTNGIAPIGPEGTEADAAETPHIRPRLGPCQVQRLVEGRIARGHNVTQKGAQ